MRYFKSQNGQVFAYDDQQIAAGHVRPDLVEMTQEEVDNHINPPIPTPTFSQALAILNAEYQKDIDVYNKAFATAALADGATEESKKLAIRAQYNARKAQFSTDYAALRTQYGV